MSTSIKLYIELKLSVSELGGKKTYIAALYAKCFIRFGGCRVPVIWR